MSESNFEANRFCGACGAALPAGDSFCPKCGTAASGASRSSVSPSASSRNPQQLDWREQRRRMRAERRSSSGLRLGGLVVAVIVIVAGLAIFFPKLPWQWFWGAVLILIGLLVAYAWATRGSSYKSQEQTPQQRSA